MKTYNKGILAIKVNGKLNFLLAEKATVMDYKTGTQLRHYRVTGLDHELQYTDTKEF